MKYLEILRAKLAELAEEREAGIARMEAVTAVAETETRSELTEAEEAEFAEARTAIETIDAEVVQVRSRIAELEAVEAGRQAADEVQRTSGGFTPPNVSRGRDPWSTEEIRFGETSRRDMHAQVRSALDDMDDLRADEKEAAERLLTGHDNKHGALARRMLVTGSPSYRSAFEKVIDGNEYALTDGEKRKLVEMRAASLTDAKGGYAVPFNMDPTIINTSEGTVNPLRELSTVKTTVTNQWAGVTSAGVTVTYGDAEATEVTESEVTIAQPEINVHKAQGLVKFSLEIEMDWSQMAGEFRSMLGEAKDDAEAVKFLLGAGDGSNEPTGLIPALAAWDTGASLLSPAVAETFAAADIYAFEDALAAKHRKRASWLADKPIYNKVRQFGTSDSHALWQYIGGGQPAELLGYPTYEASEMDSSWDAAATANNYVLAFGDFSKFYIVDRIGMVVDLIPHMMGANQLPTGERALYCYWRNGSGLIDGNAMRLLNIATTA